jgi:hypothetical protein
VGALITLATSVAVYLAAYHLRLPGERVRELAGVSARSEE